MPRHIPRLPHPPEDVGGTEIHPKRRYSRALIEETIAVWQPHYEQQLTEEAAREIIDNMTLFVSGLSGLRCDLPLRGQWEDDSS